MDLNDRNASSTHEILQTDPMLLDNVPFLSSTRSSHNPTFPYLREPFHQLEQLDLLGDSYPSIALSFDLCEMLYFLLRQI